MGAVRGAILTFLLSMVPAVEIKGAIPAGIAFGLRPAAAFFIALIGSSIILVILALFTYRVYTLLETYHIWVGFTNWVDRLVEKNKSKIRRFGPLAIFLYVAIPFPGTGTWTGAIIAGVLNIKPKHIILAVFCGNLISGFIMTFLSNGIASIVRG